MDLAVDVHLADPPGDELGVLGAEIDDKDAVVMLGHAERSPRLLMSSRAPRFARDEIYGVTRSDR
jgi:hypothetical protein